MNKTIGAAFIVMLFALGLMAIPVAATTATITPSQTVYSRSEDVKIHGEGWTWWSTVTVKVYIRGWWWNRQTQISEYIVYPDWYGTFNLNLGQIQKIGTYYVTAEDACVNNQASCTFKISWSTWHWTWPSWPWTWALIVPITLSNYYRR